LEPWEKVLVDGEAFQQTEHGKLTCIQCHGGSNNADKKTAHTAMLASPSADPQTYCAQCHAEQVASYPNSLHNTQAGYWTAINARNGGAPEDHAQLQEMFGNHCATCHTTCGECHVSQPENVGGGLFTGHVFETTPPMTRSCTACHGSRVGNEFLGKNEGFPGDVHFRVARMSCVKCHEGADLHGTQDADLAASHRLAGAQDPKCIDCHAQVAGGDDILMHQQHGDKLSCQVCHSITYSSCDGCHVAISDKSGKPFFETQATYMTFLIGRNPLPSEDRPYEYVPVRHVPASPTSYDYYGEDLLPHFDALPTWVYATPHNIQRNTPQTETCRSCHGNPDLFLTEEKVSESERAANQPVIVNELPAPVEVILAAPLQPAAHSELSEVKCIACHVEGTGGAPIYRADHAAYTEGSCATCHTLP
jgi:thiosulfate/3-mercaptopyruvate sulfurtransferase